MLKKLMISAVVGALSLGAATIASAATLSVNGGSNVTLTSDLTISGSTVVSSGETLQLFDGILFNGVPNTGGPGALGLQLDAVPTQLKFEYLGSDAGDQNLAFYSGGMTDELLFDNKSGSNPSVIRTVDSSGLVPFYFQTTNGLKCFLFAGCDASNTDGIDGSVPFLGGLSLAFYQENIGGPVIALFGDGSGDADFNDMAVRISVVPLPPAVALFAGALFGLGWLSRRRKAAATA